MVTMVFLEKKLPAIFILMAAITLLAGCSQPQAGNAISGNTVMAASPQTEGFNEPGIEELTDNADLENSLDDDIAEIERLSQELENDFSDLENMSFEMEETEKQAEELETPNPQDFE